MLIFQEEPPRISHGAMEVVLELLDWFASLDGTFLRVFRVHKSPHMKKCIAGPVQINTMLLLLKKEIQTGSKLV